MKLLFAASVVTLTMAGQSPDDFRFRAPIRLQPSAEAFHRVTVPVEAYREARSDLADLRVFNSKGESIPFAFAGPRPVERTAPSGIALPHFPVYTAPGQKGDARIDVTVRARSDGTLVSVQERPRGKETRKPVAYLLDASRVEEPLRALRFDWEAAPGAEVVKVSVEASEDLRDWRPLATARPLVRVEHAGNALLQREVELTASRVKYYRVTWDAGPFSLLTVHAEPVRAVKAPERSLKVVRATEKSSDGRLVYDLGARLPVEAVRVVFAYLNTVGTYRIEAREGESGTWHGVASAGFYRVTREGLELRSPPLEVGRQPFRYWRIQPTNPGAAPTEPPSLEVHWRPAELVFVARGSAPFTLAFGNREARETRVEVSQLIPSYQPHAEWQLAPATLGEVKMVRAETPWRRVLGEVSPRRAALWSVLVLAVLILGFMAWRLTRQARSP